MILMTICSKFITVYVLCVPIIIPIYKDLTKVLQINGAVFVPDIKNRDSNNDKCKNCKCIMINE